MANESSTTITSPIFTNAAIPIGQNTNITFNVVAHFPLKLTNNYPSWIGQFGMLFSRVTLVSEPIAPYISTVETAQQAWRILANLYANHSRSRMFTLKERLQNTRPDGCTITEFLHQLKVLADELAAIDKPLTNDDLTVYVLNGIGPKFREISTSLRAQDEPLSFEELHDRLVAHEESMHREEGRIENTLVTAHFAAMPTRKLAGANNRITTDLSNLALHSKYNGLDELLIGDGSGSQHRGDTTAKAKPTWDVPSSSNEPQQTTTHGTSWGKDIGNKLACKAGTPII
ncbi:hypothetical protein SLEP1_g56745 [Rubroshorea leprosula]|uniref:Gag protein n=1 Tax=Rubroshorea leprosula TaxID=152421 RepID=A0AAV5MKK1_9ROSI|nr:hypothetical protein SLEP1_g56745 [Rubroshorea leprosula]